jgi:ABC-type antimicrobial peptide transport system permease subunit
MKTIFSTFNFSLFRKEQYIFLFLQIFLSVFILIIALNSFLRSEKPVKLLTVNSYFEVNYVQNSYNLFENSKLENIKNLTPGAIAVSAFEQDNADWLEFNEKRYSTDNALIVPSDFASKFDIPLLVGKFFGNKEREAVVSDEFAKQLFGDTVSAISKKLVFVKNRENTKYIYTITGVISRNTAYNANIYINKPMNNFPQNLKFSTILVKYSSNANLFKQNIINTINQIYRSDSNFIKNQKQLQFYDVSPASIISSGQIVAFSTLSILSIAIFSLNFYLLITSNIFYRIKEISLYKILGINNLNVSKEFILPNFVIISLFLFISLFVFRLFSKSINTFLSNTYININIGSSYFPYFIVFLIVIFISFISIIPVVYSIFQIKPLEIYRSDES